MENISKKPIKCIKNGSVDKSDTRIEENEPPGRLGIRHLQIILMFLCICVIIGTRNNLSVAIVAMTTASSSNDSTFQIFDWDKKTQNIILSSFFWGYASMQIPAGFIVGKFGGKVPLTVALTVNGLVSFLTPFVARTGGYKSICALRVIQGLGQGLTLPSVHTLLGVWVPTEERGRLGSFVYGGLHLGVLIFMALAGVLGGSSLGWPSIFYTQGTVSLVIAMAWFCFGATCPDQHRAIKERERIFIKKSIGQGSKKKPGMAPWWRILGSPPVWAICFAHAGSGWGTQTITNEIPAYFSKVMHTSVQMSGVFSALPFLSKWLTTFLFSFASDILVNRGILPRVRVRKLYNSIGSWSVALALIALPYIKGIVAAEIVLILSLSLVSGQYAGFMINHIDLSPNYAGTLMSLSNTCSNFSSMLAPLVSAAILTDITDVAHWKYLFFATAAVVFATDAMFSLLGSADVQEWNNISNEESSKDKDDEIIEGKLENVSILNG